MTNTSHRREQLVADYLSGKVTADQFRWLLREDYTARAAQTTPDGLRYPSDYNDPADSPAALETLAGDTQTALNTRDVNLNNTAGALTAAVEGRVPRNNIQIIDWDHAIENGVYYGDSAANPPGGLAGYWLAHVVRHSNPASPPVWATQSAWPLSIGGIDGAAEMRRHCRSGAWGEWYRPANRCFSWALNDNFFFFQHGGDSIPNGASGLRMWAIGNKKSQLGPQFQGNEEFRIQRYDTAGNYAGNVMTGTMAGHVSFPGGHARTVEAKASGDPIPADTAATIGVVADMILTALVRLDLIPRTRIADIEGVLGLHVTDPPPEKDPPRPDSEEQL